MINIIHTEYTDSTKTNIHIVCESTIDSTVQCNNSASISKFLNDNFGFVNLTQEKMIALFTDNKLTIRNVQIVGIGTVNGIMLSTRDILITALHTAATGIILAHNHPSGASKPSAEDKKFTEALKNAAQLVGMQLIDHIIFASNDYYSFCEHRALAV